MNGGREGYGEGGRILNIHALVDEFFDYQSSIFGDNEPYEITLFNVSAVWPDVDTARIGINCDNVDFHISYPDKKLRNEAYRKFNSAVSGGAGYYDFVEVEDDSQ